MNLLDDFREWLPNILDERAAPNTLRTSSKISVMFKEVVSVRHPRGFCVSRNTTEIFNLHCVKITCQSNRKELFCPLRTIQLTSSSCPDAKYDYSLILPVLKRGMAVGNLQSLSRTVSEFSSKD